LDFFSIQAPQVVGAADSLATTFYADEAASLLFHPPVVPTKIAVIVDSRRSPKLIPLLLHYSSILGPEWPIHLYTSESWIPPNSGVFRRVVAEGRIAVKLLPPGIEATNQQQVSHILATPVFWEQLKPASHILLFSANSILCSNSPRIVDDFITYDFVGAPIVNQHIGGNRFDLSLWNRSLIHRILTDTGRPKGVSTMRPVEFDMKYIMQRLFEYRAKLPSSEAAGQFARESSFSGSYMGATDPGWWEEGDRAIVRLGCPEIELTESEVWGR
jgi:hypothetical protein